MAPSYDGSWLRGDVVAGLTAAAVVIPQAMAYGAIAGLPLVAGLYTALVPLVVYAVMGTSRPLSVTTTSTIAILNRGCPAAGGSLRPQRAARFGGRDPGGFSRRHALASVHSPPGDCRSLISDPVLTGFKAGVGLTIVVDQIPKLLGVQITKGHFFHNLLSIVNHLPHASVPTILLALAMLALQLGLQRFLPRVPASLVTVATGIAVSGLAGLDRFGIELVGDVKGGLPGSPSRLCRSLSICGLRLSVSP